MVDDFQISYFSKHDVDHLINALEDKYKIKIKIDLKGAKYIGIDFKWDYIKGEVILSMKGYVERALKELKFIQTKTKPWYGPILYTLPEYGKKIQYAIQDLSPDLDPEAVNYIQQVTGKFGYTSRSVYNTMQHALNYLAIAATKGIP